MDIPPAPAEPAVPAPVDAPAGWRLPPRPWDYWALWAVALISLAGNAVLIYEQWNLLNLARAQAPRVAAAAAEVRAWRQATLETTVRVNQTVPVLTNVPIQQTVIVPISATIPVNTEAQIPIGFAGFTQILRVPVRAEIPIQLDVEVPLNLTVPLRADVPVALDVPVRLSVADTALDASLAQLAAALDQFSRDLAALTPETLLAAPATETP